MQALQILTILLLLFGIGTGFAYLRTDHRGFRITCWLTSIGAAISQGVWLVLAGTQASACVIRDPWGMMGVFSIIVISASLWISHKYHSPRVLIGLLAALLVVRLAAHWVFPASESVLRHREGWLPVLHVFLAILGFSILVLGCVTGVLFLLRSFTLKAKHSRWVSLVAWPSLTTLDRLFFRTTGLGIALLCAGMLLGMIEVPGSEFRDRWLADPKVLLTSFGCILYGIVFYLRKRQGFCSRTVVGLGTIGFGLILFGFFAPSILGGEFLHSF